VMEAATGAAEGDGSGASSDVRIRQHASSEDEELWRRLLEPTFQAGETYCVPRDVSKADALAYWCMPPHEVFVARAADADGEGEEGIIGTYFITPNQPRRGGGGHVCNCGFITAAGAEGRGVARAMLRHALDHAKESGYRAMQFNFVVSTNIRAVDTWKRAGFQKAGTLPRAFDHPKKGLVDAYVMFRELV
jgi:ribosomal protein S18 acetylase RimI-like enzyme